MRIPGWGRALLGSTTWRLAIILVLTQVLTLALGLAIMQGLTQRTLTGQARVAAEVARSDLLEAQHSEGPSAVRREVEARLANAADHNFVAYLRDADGTRIAGNLESWPEPDGRDRRWTIARLSRSGASRPELIGYVVQSLPGGRSLLTGEVLEGQTRLTRASEQSFVYAMLAGLGIAGLASWLILRLLRQRIDRFSRVAGDIASGRLNTRIALTSAGDTFDRLGASINAMLERIEALVGELRAVTDSMAHDLRSPVARIRSSLERSLEASGNGPGRNALADAIDEADGLQRLLDTALEISRTEAGIGRNQFAEFDLSAMLRDLAEVYGPLAEDEGFQISVAAPEGCAVNAHRELLFRAISNLIDNALKYAEGGSRIGLSLTQDGAEAVVLTVSDDGPGIPAADRDEALRRFGRLDPARTSSGAGLGMALVSTIATMHGGTMQLDDADPHGLEVRLRLPV